MFAGNEEDTTGLKSALSRLLGAVGAIGLLSLAVQYAVGDGLGGLFGGASESAETTDVQVSVETADAARQSAEAAGSAVPPGVLFFAGGALVLALGFAWWYYANRGNQ